MHRIDPQGAIELGRQLAMPRSILRERRVRLKRR
jgi:hypothetical protein